MTRFRKTLTLFGALLLGNSAGSRGQFVGENRSVGRQEWPAKTDWLDGDRALFHDAMHEKAAAYAKEKNLLPRDPPTAPIPIAESRNVNAKRPFDAAPCAPCENYPRSSAASIVTVR